MFYFEVYAFKFQYWFFLWHLFFFISLSFSFFIISIFVTLTRCSFHFSLDLFSSWFIKLTVSFSLDLFSSWFRFVVTLISAIIIIYSYFYIRPYAKAPYFIWITVFFVLSMLFVINITNFLFIMLGWDGLGLVSFLLIVYYQNHSSVYSGLFTVLINRIGDCFFIVSISFMVLLYPNMWDSNFIIYNRLLPFFIMLTFITKRAIYPFSPWLPLAMAAPTPISALVHSSTLVTAGLYLSMRFSFMFYSYPLIISFFLVLSVFTSFYAGLNSVFEVDIKKLIALSTLSHLGFIGMAFSRGLLYLSFFHLLVHALFKSVLFMSMGDIMTNLFHSQDIRFLSSGFNFTTSSFYTISVSLINLLGLPSIRGYFSKDLILETLNFTTSSFLIVSLVFFNVLFTYYYTYQLFYFSFRRLKLSPYFIINKSSKIHTFCLLALSVVGTFFGWFWISTVTPWTIHVSVPLVWKLTPYFLNLVVFLYLLLNLSSFKVFNQKLTYYFSNIIFLSCFIITLISNFYFHLSYQASKSVEYGVLNWFSNIAVPSIFSNTLFLLVKISSVRSSFLVSISTFLVIIIFLLLSCNINNYMQLLTVKSF